MPDMLRKQIHRRGELIHTTIESAFLTAGSLLILILFLIFLFLGVFVSRAS